MVRRLALYALLAVLGTSAACAGGAARSPATAPPGFDVLVREAKQAMMADPKAALALARNAVTIADRQGASKKEQREIATGLWLVAEALARINQFPEAHAALARATKITSSDGVLDKLDGELALTAGRIADSEGDVALALKSYQKAYGIFVRLGELRGQSIALQGVGSIYEEAHDFAREIDYYNKAARVYSAEPKLQLSITNNVAFAMQLMGRYQEALPRFQKALRIASSLHSPFLEARILTNIAAVEAKLQRFSEAQSAANRALKLLGRGDQYGWSPFVWGIKAEIEYERGNLTAATADIEKAFRGVDLTKTIQPFRDMHEIAYKIYSATGNYRLALAHHVAFKRLDDEGRSLTASVNLALMGARFDFTNQKLEIERLKTDQLQRDARLRDSRAAIQRILFAGALLVSLLIIVWIGWRHRLLSRHRDDISRANTELRRILGERDEEIARRIDTECQMRIAKDAAEDANRAKSHFLANMSHELRTPLNAIIGFSEIISFRDDVPAKVKEYGNDINESGKKLLSILNQILDAARLDTGKVSLSMRSIPLDEIIETALTGCGKELTGKQVVVSGDKDVRVHADTARLTQVVEHLVSNAAKFTAADGRIEIAVARTHSGGVDVVVSDNGIGIPPEKLRNVLEPFAQVAGAYTRSHGGVGLGLPIARSLVMLHGGTMTIESEPDKGTAVTVHLPAECVLEPGRTSGLRAQRHSSTPIGFS